MGSEAAASSQFAWHHRLVRTPLGIVHCTFAGSGPLVIVLPPGNGPAPLYGLIEALSKRLTVMLVDLPGYGLSDPLSIRVPSIADYARSVVVLLTTLGINRCGIFGSHTGAAIAAELARAHPAVCSAIVLHELSVFSPAQRDDNLKRYLPAYAPEWTGSYLAAFWHRFREQYLFRPWHLKERANRKPGQGDDVDAIHDIFIYQAMAQDDYRKCYEAVLRNDLASCLQAIQIPFWVVAHEDAWITGVRDLDVGKTAVWPRAEMAERCMSVFETASGDTPDFSSRPFALVPRSLVPFRGHHLMLRYWPGPIGGVPTVIIPHMPGSAASLLAFAELLAAAGPVLLPDLPATGDSIGRLEDPSIDVYVAAVQAALSVAGFGRHHIIGVGTGAVIAVAAALASDDVAGVTLVNAPYLFPSEREEFSRNYAQPIKLEWDGTHLLHLWHALRNEQLFWPWYDQRPVATRLAFSDLDADRLDRRVLAILNHRESYAPCARTLFGYGLLEAFPDLRCPARAYTVTGELFSELGPRSPALSIAGGDSSDSADYAALAVRLLENGLRLGSD